MKAFRVGHGNPGVGAYAPLIRLTPKQIRVLRPGGRIAQGAFASIFTVEGATNMVLKITTDMTDIAALQIANRERQTKHVPKMYAAWKLKLDECQVDRKTTCEEADVEVYAAHVERLRLPDDEESVLWDDISSAAGSAFWRSVRAAGTRFGTRAYRLSDESRRFAYANCNRYATAKPCFQTTRELIKLHEFFGRHGARITDIHSGNFGYDERGVWKMLDVGYSATDPPDVEVLEGLRVQAFGRMWEL